MGDFDGYRVYELAEIVAPDAPDTMYRQAGAWRELGTALYDQAAKLSRHLEDASDAWDSRSGAAFFAALSGRAEQLMAASQQAFGTAVLWDGVAAEVATAQSTVTDIADEWAAAGCPMDDGPQSRTYSVRARRAMDEATERIAMYHHSLHFDGEFEPLVAGEAPSGDDGGSDGGPPGSGSENTVDSSGGDGPPGPEGPTLQDPSGPPPPPPGPPGPGPTLQNPSGPPVVHQPPPSVPPPVCPPTRLPPNPVPPVVRVPPPPPPPPVCPPVRRPLLPTTRVPGTTPPPPTRTPPGTTRFGTRVGVPNSPRLPGRTVPSVIGARQGTTGLAPTGNRAVNPLTRPVIGQRAATTARPSAVKGGLIGRDGVVGRSRTGVRAVRVPKPHSGGGNLNRPVIRARAAGPGVKPPKTGRSRRDDEKLIASDGPLESFWQPSEAVVPSVIRGSADWRRHRHDPGPVTPSRAVETHVRTDERQVVDRLSRRGDSETHSELWRAPETSPTIITTGPETTGFHDPGPLFGRGSQSEGSR